LTSIPFARKCEYIGIDIWRTKEEHRVAVGGYPGRLGRRWPLTAFVSSVEHQIHAGRSNNLE